MSERVPVRVDGMNLHVGEAMTQHLLDLDSPEAVAELAAALTLMDWGEHTITTEVTTEADAPNRVFESSVDMDSFAAAILAALRAGRAE